MPQLDHYNFYFSLYMALQLALFLLLCVIATVYLPMIYRHQIS